MPSARELIDMVAKATGQDRLSDEDLDSLLGLAGLAAHASERTAAPLTCYLFGAANYSPKQALELAKTLFTALEDAS